MGDKMHIKIEKNLSCDSQSQSFSPLAPPAREVEILLKIFFCWGNPVPLHDGVLKVRQIRAVVVLLHQLEEVLQEAAEFLVLDGAVAVLQ